MRQGATTREAGSRRTLSGVRLHVFLRKHRGLLGLLVLSPALGYLLVWFALPFVIVVLYSTGAYDSLGRFTGGFTLDFYQTVLSPDRPTMRIMGESLLVGLYTTLLSLLVGYPLAFFIAKAAGRWKETVLILVLIPFWTSFLIRTYALMALLHSGGPVNLGLMAVGMEPQRFLFTLHAVVLGLVYNYLFFMVLPLYAAIEKFDDRQVEAAYSLGAAPWMAFLRVVLPQTRTGIVAGSILVFILASGDFIIPALMGGAQVYLIAQRIFDAFLTGVRRWNLGSAISIVFIGIVLALVAVYMKRVAREGGLEV